MIKNKQYFFFLILLHLQEDFFYAWADADFLKLILFTEPAELCKFVPVKKVLIILYFLICLNCCGEASAQCAMCTKTAQQLGEKPAMGLNQGILYLMLAPFAIVGFIAFRWWKSRNASEEPE